jgi:DNA segregation ATPase FtsK/SpoIIIE-like protein
MSIKPEKSVLRYEIELISLLALTVLSAVAIHTNWTGFFGSLMKAIYLGLFGFAGVFLTYSIFLMVFFNINRYFSDKKWRLIGATFFAFLSIWIFSTTINYTNLYEILADKGQIIMSPEGMKASFDQGVMLRGGGVFGNSLVFALINAVGKFGAYLLGTLFAAFSIVLAFKVSLTNLVKRSGINTYNGLKPFAEKVSMPKPKLKRAESAQTGQVEVTETNAEIAETAANTIVTTASETTTATIINAESTTPVLNDNRVTVDDLPRMGQTIAHFNSDLYFEEIAKHVNLETGEYLESDEASDAVYSEVEPIEPTVEQMNESTEVLPDNVEDIKVHFSVFDEMEAEEASEGSETATETLEVVAEDEVAIPINEMVNTGMPVEEIADIEIPDFEVSYDVPVEDDSLPEVDFDAIEKSKAVEKPAATIAPAAVIKPVSAPVTPIIPPKPKPKPYIMPPLTLLNPAKPKTNSNRDEIVENVKILEVTLKNFGVDAKVTEVTKGPAITMYEVLPAPGVKVSKIVNLTDDIALALAAQQIRIIAPIPGKSAIGIEIPNKDTTMVTAREVFESDEFKKTDSKLSVALGKEITGKTMVADLAKMPHLLIAGSTGSGKSVCVNTIINSILFNAKPDEVKLLMIDPKVVELSHYNGIPHLILPVVVDPKKASIALNWAVNEMGNRYKTFAEHTVKDINSYNRKAETMPELQLEKMAKIVIIVDELADLMMVAPNQVEDAICRLAQMARAAGIHLIVATQRPSVDVITGLIKANIPSRIAFAVSSQIDSRTILDMAGAEKLLGKGDMLFYPLGANKPIRIQGAFLADAEVEGVVGFIKQQTEEVTYQEEILESVPEANNAMEADELLKDAVEMIVDSGQASISMIQRKFRVGYNRAARLIDQMEERGIVGPSLGSKPREVLMTRIELEQLKL